MKEYHIDGDYQYVRVSGTLPQVEKEIAELSKEGFSFCKPFGTPDGEPYFVYSYMQAPLRWVLTDDNVTGEINE